MQLQLISTARVNQKTWHNLFNPMLSGRISLFRKPILSSLVVVMIMPADMAHAAPSSRNDQPALFWFGVWGVSPAGSWRFRCVFWGCGYSGLLLHRRDACHHSFHALHTLWQSNEYSLKALVVPALPWNVRPVLFCDNAISLKVGAVDFELNGAW